MWRRYIRVVHIFSAYHGGIYRLIIGKASERLGHSASWEPLGGSPELPQLGPEILGFGELQSGSHDAERQNQSSMQQPKIMLKLQLADLFVVSKPNPRGYIVEFND